MQRKKTGITGFDELIEGGLPQSSFTVVTGGPGTGKSIFAQQFLASGIKEFGEKGLYISVEQPREEIIDQGRLFGWDFETFEAEGKLKIIALNSAELFEMQKINEIKNLIQENHYDRVVIDSITSFIYSPISSGSIADGAGHGIGPGVFAEMCRANAAGLIDSVKQMGITAVGVAQKVEGMPGDTLDNVSEFKGDGLVVLDAVEIGDEINRTLRVKKLRKTKINAVTQHFEFTERGITVFPKEV